MRLADRLNSNILTVWSTRRLPVYLGSTDGLSSIFHQIVVDRLLPTLLQVPDGLKRPPRQNLSIDKKYYFS